MNRIALPLVALLSLIGCRSISKTSSTTRPSTTRIASTYPEPASLDAAMQLLDHRGPWADPTSEFPRLPAEKFLQGWVIVLDPGHGASDAIAVEKDPHYKRGPTGVREDDINLRVGKLLERLLRDGGATVKMTRTEDVYMSLADRVAFANRLPRPEGGTGADLFIALHHNATDNPESNYTSTWYHGEVDDAEVALDLAEPVCHAVSRALRTDWAKTSPVFSDQLMYKSGFGMLRGLNMPGFLIEASFYTQPDEEQRLRDAVYNLREAYAIYSALCEYAYGGRPSQSSPKLVVAGDRVKIDTELSTGLPPWWGKDRNRIISSSVRLRVGGADVVKTFDPPTRVVSTTVDVSVFPIDTPVVVDVRFTNQFKHANWPQRYEAIRRSGVGGREWFDVRPLGPAHEHAPATTRVAR